MTPPTSADQNRLSEPALLIARRPITGIRSALTRSPSRLRTAGSSVSAAITETMPTRIAPSARLRRTVSGTSSIPHIASTKAMPLKSTARLAVAPEATIASIFSSPRAALFPEAREDEERVVDPEREPHRRDHVHDEERDLERLADERRQGDRDHDREQPEQHRHEARDDRPEHEHEDDQRRRQPDQQLALLQVLLGELLEVGVGRQGAGDRDLEAVLPVLGCDQLDERSDLVAASRSAAPSSRADPSRRATRRPCRSSSARPATMPSAALRSASACTFAWNAGSSTV